MASVEAQVYNGAAGSRGRAPGHGAKGCFAPLKLKSFFHWNVQRRGKFVPFSALSVFSMPEVDYTV